MQCEIKIKSPTYPITPELVIQHDSSDTILSLKGKIKDRIGNAALVESSQKLIYAGHVLEDGKTLSQSSVRRPPDFLNHYSTEHHSDST